MATGAAVWEGLIAVLARRSGETMGQRNGAQGDADQKAAFPAYLLLFAVSVR